MRPRISYRSAYDAWFVIVSASAIGASAVSFVYALATARGSELYLTAAVLVAVTALSAFIAWLVFSIRYDITDDALVIRFGPFRSTIPLKDILEVEPTRSIMSAPAGSLRRLKVTFRRQTWTAYSLISPKDRTAFLRDLSQACPGLIVTGSRAVASRAATPEA